MRISDWSSDVCSSDLCGQQSRFIPDREFISRRPHLSNESSRSGTKARRHIHPWVAIPENQQVGVTSPPAFDIRYFPAKPIAPLGRSCTCLEIGRASCRERVLSVRVDLGGRRNIKKKTTQK